jgi:hypothetical protein
VNACKIENKNNKIEIATIKKIVEFEPGAKDDINENFKIK